MGISSICLVIGPEHTAVREHYARLDPLTRLSLEFAVQAQPNGTADAVLAAERFAAAESVLMVNGDNYYPGNALAALAGLPRAGIVGFRQSGLLAAGNISGERVRAFALMEVDDGGCLRRILEKPTEPEMVSFGPDPLVSMNAWLLPPTIYGACRMVEPSSRGELELQDAVRIAMERMGERFRVVESVETVLDLSTRADVPAVAALLASTEVWL